MPYKKQAPQLGACFLYEVTLKPLRQITIHKKDVPGTSCNDNMIWFG